MNSHSALLILIAVLAAVIITAVVWAAVKLIEILRK